MTINRLILPLISGCIYSLIFYSCSTTNDTNMITEKCPYEKIAFINNSSLKHSIVLMACDTCKPITTVGYRVVVDLKESELQTAESLNKECWIELLENEKTDWAANLILYNLHNKDAVLLSDGDSSGWKKHSKAKEISDWKKELP